LRFAGGEVADGGEDFAGVVARGESVEDFVDARHGGRNSSTTNGKRLWHQ
jgi:hypothetical protein